MAFRTLYEMFSSTVSKYPDKTALMVKKEGRYVPITYKEMKKNIDNLSRGLYFLGAKKGDKISLLSENRPEWVYSDLAMQKLGIANVPIYTTLAPAEIEYLVNNSESTMIIVSNERFLKTILSIINRLPKIRYIIVFDDFAPSLKSDQVLSLKDVLNIGAQNSHLEKAVEELHNSVGRDDLASIVYTSGTTGNPKGAMLTQGNFLSNCEGCEKVTALYDTDIALSFLPLSHTFERIVYYMCILRGATIAYAESIDTVAQNLVEVKPTIMAAVPRMFEKMYARILENVEKLPEKKKKIFYSAIETGKEFWKQKEQGKVKFGTKIKYALMTKLVFKKIHERVGGRIRFFVSGGAPLSPDLAKIYRAMGFTILEGYGLTETSPVLTVNRPDSIVIGSVGLPLPNVEIKIAPDGEILARGPNIMKGYYNMPDATKAAIDDEGWFHTGDIGKLDEKGYLYITDRKKEIIVMSTGKKVAPQPIENLLKANKYITNVMLIGDNRNYITALVVPNFDTLKTWCREHNIVDENPQTLVKNEKVLSFYNKLIDEATKDFASYEKIKKITLLPKDFTMVESFIRNISTLLKQCMRRENGKR